MLAHQREKRTDILLLLFAQSIHGVAAGDADDLLCGDLLDGNFKTHGICLRF